MKDLDFMGNLAKNPLVRFFSQAPQGGGLMDETNSQLGRSSADKFAGSKILPIKPHGQSVTGLTPLILLQLTEIPINIHCFESAFVLYAG